MEILDLIFERVAGDRVEGQVTDPKFPAFTFGPSGAVVELRLSTHNLIELGRIALRLETLAPPCKAVGYRVEGQLIMGGTSGVLAWGWGVETPPRERSD